MHVICFCICICLFKNKQITKKTSVVKVLTSIITSTRLAVTIVIMHVLTFTTVIILYLWEKNISISLTFTTEVFFVICLFLKRQIQIQKHMTCIYTILHRQSTFNLSKQTFCNITLKFQKQRTVLKTHNVWSTLNISLVIIIKLNICCVVLIIYTKTPSTWPTVNLGIAVNRKKHIPCIYNFTQTKYI
jgi:hypothetical protein